VLLQSPIVGIAATPDGGGYWLVDQDGQVTPFGDAAPGGSLSAPQYPVVGIAANPNGGYYVVDAGGCIYPFAGAPFFGSMCFTHLYEPVVAMALTHGGEGYWLVASDGGIFSFGDAAFYGSLGGMHIDSPIAGIAATLGGGYWLTTEDGSVYPFSAPGPSPTEHDFGGIPVSGIASNPVGLGYWLVDLGADVQATGDASTYPPT